MSTLPFHITIRYIEKVSKKKAPFMLLYTYAYTYVTYTHFLSNGIRSMHYKLLIYHCLFHNRDLK